MRKLERFRDAHLGERCVIVCNGPSLNAMDLTVLRGEVVFGMNKIHLGLARFGFYPRYLVAVNDKVIEQAANELARMTCIKFLSRNGVGKLPGGLEGKLAENAFTYHIKTRSVEDRFCRDISVGVREGGTVTYAALQIAHYMGFHDVIIIGMDHRYTFTGKPNETKRMDGPDPNHFSPAYFQGKTWDNPDLARSEESYALARDVFAASGRRIRDATLDGECQVFEKADFRALMAQA